MNSETESLKLHFKYCAAIAFIVIVFLVSEKWSDKAGFTSYLSNAATMTSLLLGVVAIFYSFISNDGMSRGLGSITTVANEVREVRGDIERFAEQTKISTATATANNTLVKGTSDKLSETMTSLDVTLQAISSQNHALKALVESLPSRIDQLENRFGDVAKVLDKQENPKVFGNADIPDDAVRVFIGLSTFNQNLLMIACVKSFESGKPVDLDEFCKVIEFSAANQYQGFVACMNAMRLCEREIEDKKGKIFKVNAINSVIHQEIRSIFMSDAELNYKDDPENYAKLVGLLAAVEALYASP